MKPGGACAPLGCDWDAMFSSYSDLLTIKDVAEITGMTPQYLRQMARQGKLPAVHIGDRTYGIVIGVDDIGADYGLPAGIPDRTFHGLGLQGR